MKSISILIFIIALLLFSCKKEEVARDSNHPNIYYFQGLLMDTTNGNSVKNYRLSLFSCNLISQDTITDSSYLLKFITLTGSWKGFNCVPNADVEIFDSTNRLIKTINIPRSKWVKHTPVILHRMDTGYIDLKF